LRLGRDDRGRGIHHHHELLGLLGDIAGGKGIRRQHEAGQNVDLVAHYQFLREALGGIRRDATDILADEFELLAGDGVAVLLHIELDGVVELVAGIGELARIRQNQTDLDRVLRARGGRREECGGKAAKTNQQCTHRAPSETLFICR